MGVSLTEFYMQLWNKRTDLAVIDDTGRFIVTTVDTASRPVVYEDRQAGITITNSIGTISSGVIQFFIASATTIVDLSVMTAEGQYYFVEDLTPSQHKLMVDPEKREYLAIVPFNGEAADGVEFDSEINFPVGAVITDCEVRVINGTASEVLDVGLETTDPNGFLAALPLDSAGLVTSKGAANNGSNIDFVDAIQRGALLSPGLIQGTDVVAVSGAVVHNHYLVATAAHLTYEQTNSVTADGYILVKYYLTPDIA